jgi:hypothetical protein
MLLLVKDLFKNVVDGYSYILKNQPYWKNMIPEKYHKFGGRLCKLIGTHLENAEPVYATLCPSEGEPYYNEQEYGKRLIGNAFSIPVVEVLLRELQGIFPQATYVGNNNHNIPNVAKGEEEAELDGLS